MDKEITIREVGNTYHDVLVEAGKLFTNDDEVENMIVVVAKRNHDFHVLTDVSYPLHITVEMLTAAVGHIAEQQTRLAGKIPTAVNES